MNLELRNRSKIWKRLTALFCVIVLIMAFPAKSYALGEKWDCPGDGWYYLPGTDVRVKVEPDVITFEGNGAIPDYNHDTMSNRPWHGSKAKYVFIGQGITSIGTYAFAKLDKLTFIQMYSTTFVADYTCFYHIDDASPAIRIIGAEETTQMYGTIPYTSLDSIAAVAQTGYGGNTYIFDNKNIAEAFKNRTNPSIGNVYDANYEIKKDDDGKKKDSPWFNQGEYSGDITYTNICKLSPSTPNSSLDVTGQKRIQGKACYEAFGAFIGNYQYAEMYRLQVQKGDKEVTTTDNPYTYVWNIPAKYQLPGRTFKMLAIGSGTVITYEDEDNNDATFTMTTSTPTTAYCLVYVQ